jgi:hypothetical protein
MPSIKGNSDIPEVSGVLGESSTFNGVLGYNC